MKLSVLTVTYNDDRHLAECLVPLCRFDELIVVDLGSTDRSVAIAEGLGARVYRRDWVPAIELILSELAALCSNDWILRVDPDEVLPSSLVDELLALEIGESCGVVAIPVQYYFMRRKLDATFWGGIRYANRVSHKGRTSMENRVHRAPQCKPGFDTHSIAAGSDNVVTHYWAETYTQLFRKHNRYLALEGASRFSQGDRFSWRRLATHAWSRFITSFHHKSGWRGGWDGWFLSFFHAYYEARAWLSLRRYEAQRPRD